MHQTHDPHFLGGLLAFTGATLMTVGAFHIWRGWGTGNWRPVPGEVTEAFVEEVERENSRGEIRVSFKPRIVYKYKVHGKEYEGGTLQRGLINAPSRGLAESKVADYRNGQRVTVYYMPSDPSHAVLKRGAPLSPFVMFGAGLIFVLVGWWVWFLPPAALFS